MGILVIIGLDPVALNLILKNTVLPIFTYPPWISVPFWIDGVIILLNKLENDPKSLLIINYFSYTITVPEHSIWDVCIDDVANLTAPVLYIIIITLTSVCHELTAPLAVDFIS